MDGLNTAHVRLVVVLMCIFVAVSVGTTTDENGLPVVVQSNERRLVNALLARYKTLDKVARPLINSSNTITVQFGIRLVHLELDEKDQLMKTSCWVRMVWYDEYLSWDPEAHGGVQRLIIPADRVWVPDISLVNTGETELKEQRADLSVRSDGRVFWTPQRRFSSACLIDVTEYPYDRHTCEMWFQSMSNSHNNLNLSIYNNSPLDLDTYLSSYKFSQEWDIVSNTSERHNRPRDVGMILMYSRRAALRFSLTSQRRPGFKAMLLIVPCTLLSFLFPLIFCFPVDRPDRHTLAMSLFASLTILLFMVNDTAPPSAAFVPRLTLYYCFNLLVLLVATSCSAVVVNLSKRGETRDRVPRWVKKVFITWCGKVVCFRKKQEQLSQVKRASIRIRQRRSKMEQINQEEQTTPEVHETHPAEQATGRRQTPAERQVMVDINRKLSVIEDKMQMDKDEEMPDVSAPVDVRLEWRLLSLVLDRLFFVIFVVTDCVSFLVFHPRYED